jgi:transposase
MKNVIGIDLGDKNHVAVIFDHNGTESRPQRIPNTRTALEKVLKKYPDSTVVMEAGTHSPWISRLVEEHGCTAHVGQPRKIRAIWDTDDKSDERDARMLGKLYQFDPAMIPIVHHRGMEAQADLAVVQSRRALMETRQKLINHVRSTVKSFGERLTSCGAASFAANTWEEVPEALCPALKGVYASIETLTEQIKEAESEIHRLCLRYPETELMRQVPGVGPLTALSFALVIEDPTRFQKSREVGSFLGLTPKRDQSGETDKQLRITRSGDTALRTLLVNCATYILKENSPDCDLKRAGLRISERGGPRAKRTAKVAVARKLAVKLHRIWADNASYEPFYTGADTCTA